ncbi:MAG TPA: hypothetical protein VGM86_28570 [Thermoanaerobaculia bacterium]|jgi:hypothetical protein
MNKKVKDGDQLTPGESPKFQLKRGRERKLGVEELTAVVGGATAACCLGCSTDGTGTTCRCPP